MWDVSKLAWGNLIAHNGVIYKCTSFDKIKIVILMASLKRVDEGGHQIVVLGRPCISSVVGQWGAKFYQPPTLCRGLAICNHKWSSYRFVAFDLWANMCLHSKLCFQNLFSHVGSNDYWWSFRVTSLTWHGSLKCTRWST